MRGGGKDGQPAGGGGKKGSSDWSVTSGLAWAASVGIMRGAVGGNHGAARSVDRLAGQGTVPMWREEDAGDRLELLILGIRYIFETLRDWNLNSKFGRLSSKQVKVLESRETKNARHAPKGMKKYQCFDKELNRRFTLLV